MRAALRASSLLSLVLTVSACGAILSLEPLEFTEDDEAGTNGRRDGAVDEPETSTSFDASVTETGADSGDADAGPPTFCEQLDGSVDGGGVVFCDDFDRDGPPEKGWGSIATVNGALSLSAEQATSGSQSLLVTIVSGTTAAENRSYLTTPAIPLTSDHEILELDYFVDDAPAPTGSFAIARAITSTSYAQFNVQTLSVGASNPLFVFGSSPASLPTKEWYHFRWYVSVGMEVGEITPLDGGATVTRTPNDNRNPTSFWVGADTAASGGPVRLFIDNVVVHR